MTAMAAQQSDQLVCRPMEPRDYGEVREIHQQERTGLSADAWQKLSPAQRDYLLRETDPGALDYYRGSGYTFVVELGGEIVGFVVAYSTRRGLTDVIWVREIVVKSEHRERGIGTALYARLKRQAENAGVDHIFATIDLDNVASQRLHEKVGFNLDERIVARLNLSPARKSVYG